MLLLASSVCGLFKWRQFEPEVILMAVGMVPAFFTVVPGRGGVARRAGSARRSRHRLEVGSALRPRSQSAPALKAQTDQRQLARGRNLCARQRQLGVLIPGCGFERCDDRL